MTEHQKLLLQRHLSYCIRIYELRVQQLLATGQDTDAELAAAYVNARDDAVEQLRMLRIS